MKLLVELLEFLTGEHFAPTPTVVGGGNELNRRLQIAEITDELRKDAAAGRVNAEQAFAAVQTLSYRSTQPAEKGKP